MKITRIAAYQVDLPLHRGHLQLVGRQVGHRLRQHDRPGRDRRRHRRLRRGLPARAVLPAGLRHRRPRRDRRARPASARRGPARARAAEPPDGRRAQGTPLRQVGHRHGLLGHPRQGRRACRSARCWAAATATTSCSIAPSRRSRPRRWPRRVAGYRAEGYRRFQLKVGGDPDDRHRPHPRRGRRCCEPGDRLIADANTGWLMHDAARVVRAVRDVDVYIEQPCLSYEECLSIRRQTDHPFVLDEVDRRHRRAAARPRRPGDGRGQPQDQQARRPDEAPPGARPVRLARHRHDLEDSWGGDIVTAAIAHLAHSTPPEFLFTATDFNSYVTVSTADGAPRRQNGRMAASTQPGLGITPKMDVLGQPKVEVR